METFDSAWLIVNAASGSNSPAALEDLRQCLADHGIEVAREIDFPDDDLPTPEQLDQAGVPLLVIYTGDGTLNAAIRSVEGWGGAVLVLPGGTMNLLSKRLHGDFSNKEILDIVAAAGALRRRIAKIVGPCGEAYAGLLAGPATQWGEVREAMRDLDIAAMASGAAEALEKSTGDTKTRVFDPLLGDREGYPLIELTPGEHGIQLDVFHADDAGEFAAQTWALMRRSFRDGPHDRLGLVDAVTLENVDGSQLQVLLDGEKCQAGARVTFEVAPSDVDLLATYNG
ncbi:diacylglycerol kinase family protein [Qipengyuania sp.]|uniref:diacylglycerol kinase family protein n=1 Tax=Qipengyuania sp. TaxID=2004515 RepID=UPI0035C7C182